MGGGSGGRTDLFFRKLGGRERREFGGVGGGVGGVGVGVGGGTDGGGVGRKLETL